uniref:Uncharacterized protein n=1 Tax=Catharus ustulatus TaxID=91951 RepID=A0A8C3TTC2_CATUS
MSVCLSLCPCVPSYHSRVHPSVRSVPAMAAVLSRRLGKRSLLGTRVADPEIPEQSLMCVPQHFHPAEGDLGTSRIPFQELFPVFQFNPKGNKIPRFQSLGNSISQFQFQRNSIPQFQSLGNSISQIPVRVSGSL